ncbi:MAG: type II toxin-antitoxin system RelE/ParE family toxin [Deltaproteobacteria bacterium]|nr:type II toxin-antitoxin system RelE/ParE family toxin [Deltaproteobacteria bacterium]
MAAESDDLLHPEARTELREAVAWYRGKGAGAMAFVAQITRIIDDLVRGPKRWPALRNVSPLIRYRVLPKKHPYTIFYRETATSILILAFAHQKRQPLYWVYRH